jgi:hypothetical protein
VREPGCRDAVERLDGLVTVGCLRVRGRQGQPGFASPVHDINAPDLYIPVMSFITFVLMTGLLKGTKSKFVGTTWRVAMGFAYCFSSGSGSLRKCLTKSQRLV